MKLLQIWVGLKLLGITLLSKTVFVYVHILDAGLRKLLESLSSNNPQESIFVRGLEAIELTFSTKVEDFDGNITELRRKKENLHPLFEEKIDKSSWTLISGNR